MELLLQVHNINSTDKSGLVIGLLKTDHINDTALAVAKSHMVALNAKGFQYTYNTQKVKDYSLNTGDVLKLSVSPSEVLF